MKIPRLHLVTNDEILSRPHFVPAATDLLLNLQHRVAIHLRGHSTTAHHRFNIAEQLLEKAEVVQSLLVVNDRVDIALTAGARAVHLGAHSLPVGTVRAMGGSRLAIGYSAHSASEARNAETDGADFIFAGTIFPTASHPGRPAGGSALLSEVTETCTRPVLAIGGVTPERVPEVLRTGAYGVAVISSVWNAADPVQAADEIVRLLDE